MKTIRALHIASFTGNIGDNANHMGFRPWFESNFTDSIEWTNLEIREFYWKERAWDRELVTFINTFDVLVIGGGNYFELWVDSSPTGTSIAIELDLFKQIKVPVLFNALGVDPGQGVPETSLAKFQEFMTVLDAPQYLVTVRNDGALKNMQTYVGERYASLVHRVPDGGFFVSDYNNLNGEAKKGVTSIVMNIASDMPETRFKGFANGESGFTEEIAKTITELANEIPDSEYILVPHIFRDLEIITRVIESVSDRLRRTRIKVAAYGHGDIATLDTLKLYSEASIVLGMRFHANVCAMSLEKPVLGLCCYPQIFNLYEEVGLSELAIDVSSAGFSSELVAKTKETLIAESHKNLSAPKKQASEMRDLFKPTLTAWLNDNSLANAD